MISNETSVFLQNCYIHNRKYVKFIFAIDWKLGKMSVQGQCSYHIKNHKIKQQ